MLKFSGVPFLWHPRAQQESYTDTNTFSFFSWLHANWYVLSIQFLLMCPPYVTLFVNAFHYRFDSSVFFFHGATMPRVRSHTISRSPSFFHTDMQTQLEVYNAAQRLLRTEPRTIRSVQTNIPSMQLDANLICKCKRTDCFAISEILCYLGSSLSLSLIVHDHWDDSEYLRRVTDCSIQG